MADLQVRPSVVVGPEDIITADLLNLLATPVVDLSLEEPINDQSFLRNGNFYSAFWQTPGGLTCPVGAETFNADYWGVLPTGAAVSTQRSSLVPDTNSLFSHEIDGAVNVGNVQFFQNINGDLSATLRRICTFSGNIYNNSGVIISPELEIYTANSFNDFNHTTLQATFDLQTCSNGVWTFVSCTIDLSVLANVANGLSVTVLIPSGALSSAGKSVNFSRIKFQIGEIATEFTDDVSLFVTTPSIDSTMLQDGCIARSSLFAPNVIPSGAFQVGAIQSSDIADGTIQGIDLAPGAISSGLGFVPINKAGDTHIGNASVITTGTTTAASISVTAVVSTTGMVAGMVVSGPGIPSGATIATVVSPTAFNLSTPATASGTGVTLTVASVTGGGQLSFDNDTVVGSSATAHTAITVTATAANVNNDGYMPAVGFLRPGIVGRSIGLSTTNRFKTVDASGTVGYLLDTVTGVDTNSYQAASITYGALAQSLINLLVPIGTIHLFAGVNPPSGWFVCDGSAVSRTTYSALFAQLGTYWGVGDNSTTFNIPNFVNRVPVGYGSGASYGFGGYGGEPTHQLSIAEMPTHDHGYSQTPHGHGTHSHNINGVVGVGAGNSVASGSGWLLGGSTTDAQPVPAANASISFSAQGSYTAHNNMQPFGVCYFIIKAV